MYVSSCVLEYYLKGNAGLYKITSNDRLSVTIESAKVMEGFASAAAAFYVTVKRSN